MTAELPEFSRPIEIENLKDEPRHEEVVASEEECASLATRLGLEKLENFTADVTLRKDGVLIRVGGKLRANVSQKSVVSLKTVATEITEMFEASFTLDPQQEVSEEGLDVLMDADIPEAVRDGVIDIGEVIAQHLALALDPYPRGEEEGFEGRSFGPDGETTIKGPFSALEALKNKGEQ